MATVAVSKHTPGPWTHLNDQFVRHGKAILAEVFIQNPRNDKNIQARNANARLIAAAPEMLEALKAWEHWYSVDSTEFNREVAQMKGLDAIAKAEVR